MLAPRSAIPAFLLLLLTSARASPAAGNTLAARALSDLTNEQSQRIDDLENKQPDCVRKCGDDFQNSQQSHYFPRCAAVDQSSNEGEHEASWKNSYSCLCTDKVFVANIVGCLVKNCGSNSTAFEIALSGQYGTCKLYADVIYPKPEVFLNDLCLLDDMPKGATVPTDVPDVKSIWPDYTFANDFPQKTATTWTPSGTALSDFYPSGYTFSEPKLTCTPAPLASQGSTSASITGSDAPAPTATGSNGTTKGNSTVTPDKSAASSEKQGILGISVVVAVVAGLAIFL